MKFSATGLSADGPSVAGSDGDARLRTETLAEAGPSGESIPESVLSLHRVLTSRSPSGYWTGTQAELAGAMRYSERTVRFAVDWMRQREIVRTMRTGSRGELTYFLLGPVASDPVAEPDFRSEALPEAHKASAQRAHAGSPSSSSSRPPEAPPLPPGSAGGAGSTGSTGNASRLLGLGIEPTAEVLDALARLDHEQREEVFRRVEIYEARAPMYVLKTVDTVSSWSPRLAPAQPPVPASPNPVTRSAMLGVCLPLVRHVLLSLVSRIDGQPGVESRTGLR